MQAQARDMTRGRPLPLLLKFSLPLMAGSMLQQVYTMTDAAIVSNFVGLPAMAALGCCDWPSYMVISMLQGLAHGFSILVAQRFGEKDGDGVKRAIAHSVLLAAMLGALLMVASLLGAAGLLRLMNTPDAQYATALTYLSILFWGLPVTLCYHLLGAILRAFGDSKTPLIAMAIGTVSNIGLDLLFVLSFRWGVAGAAGATVIGQGLAAGYCAWALRSQPLMRLSKRDFGGEPGLNRRLVGLGVPVSLQNAIIGAGGIVLQGVINGFGTVLIAGFVATNKLYGLLELAGISFGYAVSTFVGQNLGARRLDRVRHGTRTAALLGLCVSAAIGLIMFVFGRHVLQLFIPQGAESAAQVMAVAQRYLRVMSACLPILYLLHVYRSALQGLGDTFIPMLSGLAELAMRVGAALVLARLLGETGIYLAEVLAWAGAAALLVWGYFKRVSALQMA